LTKTIFAIKGISNTGKTSTIKTVYELLKEKYPTATINTIHNCSDINIIITIDEISIGIESQGDPNSRLENSLKIFIEHKCKIIICATRTRGMTCEWVNTYSDEYNIEWLPKIKSATEANQTKENIAFANQIMQKIQNLID